MATAERVAIRIAEAAKVQAQATQTVGERLAALETSVASLHTKLDRALTALAKEKSHVR